MATVNTRTSLEMVYQTITGKEVTYSVSDPKTGLTQATVDTYMDDVIAKDIYANKAGKLASKVKAQIVAVKIEALA